MTIVQSYEVGVELNSLRYASFIHSFIQLILVQCPVLSKH